MVPWSGTKVAPYEKCQESSTSATWHAILVIGRLEIENAS